MIDFTLCLATREDVERLYWWRNDPWALKNSLSNKPVEWNEHLGWLEHVIASKSHLLYIVEPNMGWIRFDKDGSSATISVHLLEQFTGQGIGPKVIMEACKRYSNLMPTVDEIKAIILRGNKISISAFGKAWFEFSNLKNPNHVEMVWRVVEDQFWVD